MILANVSTRFYIIFLIVRVCVRRPYWLLTMITMLTLLNPSSVWLMLFGWIVLHNPFAISILVLVTFFSGWWPNPIKYCYSLTMDGPADSLQLFVLNRINIPLPFDVIDNVWLVCIRLCVDSANYRMNIVRVTVRLRFGAFVVAVLCVCGCVFWWVFWCVFVT